MLARRMRRRCDEGAGAGRGDEGTGCRTDRVRMPRSNGRFVDGPDGGQRAKAGAPRAARVGGGRARGAWGRRGERAAQGKVTRGAKPRAGRRRERQSVGKENVSRETFVSYQQKRVCCARGNASGVAARDRACSGRQTVDSGQPRGAVDCGQWEAARGGGGQWAAARCGCQREAARRGDRPRGGPGNGQRKAARRGVQRATTSGRPRDGAACGQRSAARRGRQRATVGRAVRLPARGRANAVRARGRCLSIIDDEAGDMRPAPPRSLARPRPNSRSPSLAYPRASDGERASNEATPSF